MKKILVIISIGVLIPTAFSLKAQDTLLVATTGPNVLGSNELQWTNRLGYNNSQYYTQMPYGHATIHGIGLASSLRLGVGIHTELTLDLDAVSTFGKTFDSSSVARFATSFVPTLGVRLNLYKGHGWLPQTTFVTTLSVDSRPGTDLWFLQPKVGLQFRDRMGRHWLLDYSLAYSWNQFTNILLSFDNRPWQYSLVARWLPNDHLMFGIGVENGYDHIDAFWQATPNLQVSLQGNARGGWLIAMGQDMSTVDLQLGLHWLLPAL